MQTLPRKITEPLFFAPQNHGDFVLCPAKLWSNADFAPRNRGDIVSGDKNILKLDFLLFLSDFFVNHRYFRDLSNYTAGILPAAQQMPKYLYTLYTLYLFLNLLCILVYFGVYSHTHAYFISHKI